MNRKHFFVVLLILTLAGGLMAQGDRGINQPINLVTIPTAGVLPRGAYAVECRLFPGGGLWGQIGVGVFERFMFGVSYGGGNIIGNQKINWYNQPGVEVRYRFLEESVKFPALLLGFSSQGFGNYLDSLKRYETKAHGFYAVASKNFHFLGNLGLHAGINYNPLEKTDGDADPSFFLGIDKDLNSEIALVVEYDAALNDNHSEISMLGKGRGYLNAGIRWRLVDKFTVEVDFNNILLNREEVDFMNRELKLTFSEIF
ncbi:MAG: hypothetical protein WC957_00670 [Candidatus Neomarinimicrobiota bacterium]|jgi:hypothetical protein